MPRTKTYCRKCGTPLELRIDDEADYYDEFTGNAVYDAVYVCPNKGEGGFLSRNRHTRVKGKVSMGAYDGRDYFDGFRKDLDIRNLF